MKIVIAIFLSLIGVVTAVMLFIVYTVSAPTCVLWCTSSADVSAESFIVNIGETNEAVIARLEQESYIKSEMIMDFLFTWNKDYTSIKAGEYKLSKSMDMQEIYNTLRQPPEKIWVAVPDYRDNNRLGVFLLKD